MAGAVSVRIDPQLDEIFKLKWREDGYESQEALLRKLVRDYVSGDTKGTRYPEIAQLKAEHRKVILDLAVYVKRRPEAIEVLQPFLDFARKGC